MSQLLKPDNCQVEPPYPLPTDEHVVVFSIRDPDNVAHRKHNDCAEEYPHPIQECGMFDAAALRKGEGEGEGS